MKEYFKDIQWSHYCPNFLCLGYFIHAMTILIWNPGIVFNCMKTIGILFRNQVVMQWLTKEPCSCFDAEQLCMFWLCIPCLSISWPICPSRDILTGYLFWCSIPFGLDALVFSRWGYSSVNYLPCEHFTVVVHAIDILKLCGWVYKKKRSLINLKAIH